jgi:hypothetical protein
MKGSNYGRASKRSTGILAKVEACQASRPPFPKLASRFSLVVVDRYAPVWCGRLASRKFVSRSDVQGHGASCACCSYVTFHAIFEPGADT